MDGADQQNSGQPVPSVQNFKLPEEHVYDGRMYSIVTKKEHLDKLKQFRLYPEDVVLACPPKCGTAWITEIVWLVKNGVDVEKAKAVPNKIKVPTIDISLPDDDEPNVDRFNKQPPGRLFATHLDTSFYDEQLVEAKPKVIVLLRNPKDRLVSYYHFHKSNAVLNFYPGTFRDFFRMNLEHKVQHGNYLTTALSWWKYRNEANFLFLMYEEMKKDPKAHVAKIASFLGITLNEKQIEIIVDHTSFDNMKSNPKSIDSIFNDNISSYLRKGSAGDWKSHFTVAENEVMDKVIQETLAGSGLEFIYE